MEHKQEGQRGMRRETWVPRTAPCVTHQALKYQRWATAFCTRPSPSYPSEAGGSPGDLPSPWLRPTSCSPDPSNMGSIHTGNRDLWPQFSGGAGHLYPTHPPLGSRNSQCWVHRRCQRHPRGGNITPQGWGWASSACDFWAAGQVSVSSSHLGTREGITRENRLLREPWLWLWSGWLYQHGQEGLPTLTLSSARSCRKAHRKQSPGLDLQEGMGLASVRSGAERDMHTL